MGPTARFTWIIRVFAFALGVSAPGFAHSAATAQGVALNAGAGCSRGDLDLTLTTVVANRESWRATNLVGTTLVQAEQATSLSTFIGTFTGFQIVFLAGQPTNTLIGSYAYVGDTPPTAANTAEFFVYYNCTNRQVLLSCFGPYGKCPQTAQQAAAALASQIPTLGAWSLPLIVLVVGGVGAFALRRRSA